MTNEYRVGDHRRAIHKTTDPVQNMLTNIFWGRNSILSISFWANRTVRGLQYILHNFLCSIPNSIRLARNMRGNVQVVSIKSDVALEGVVRMTSDWDQKIGNKITFNTFSDSCYEMTKCMDRLNERNYIVAQRAWRMNQLIHAENEI